MGLAAPAGREDKEGKHGRQRSMQRSTAQHSMALHCITSGCSIAWQNSARRSTAQDRHSTAQHSAAQHSTAHQARLLDAAVAQQQQLRALVVGQDGVHLKGGGTKTRYMYRKTSEWE